MKEHSGVTLLNQLGKIPAGSDGVIVYIYSADPAVFEVEFFNQKKETIGLETVNEKDLKLRYTWPPKNRDKIE